MSEFVEDAARKMYENTRIAEGEWVDWDGLPDTRYDWEAGWPKSHWVDMANTAIVAAEPHLRRKHRQELLDELIAEAEESFLTIDDGEVVNWYHLDRPVDWLKAHRENE